MRDAALTLTTREALRRFLREAQRRREERLSFTVEKPLAASLSDPQLRALIDQLLPMAQERAAQLRRERGGGWRVTLRLRYRAGVRIADAYGRGDTDALSPEERETLARALTMIALAQQDTPAPPLLARRLFDAARACAAYDNPATGTAAHSQVVSAVSALLGGRANCQGFSDAYYLLGTLAGFQVGYQAGFKGRQPHLWNVLLLENRWHTVDVTAGIFAVFQGKNPPISEKHLHNHEKMCYTELDLFHSHDGS